MIVITILAVVMMFVSLIMTLVHISSMEDTIDELIDSIGARGVVEEREHYYHKYVLDIPNDVRRCTYCQKQSREALRDLMDNN